MEDESKQDSEQSSIVYVVKYGNYIDDGYINKFASCEKSIKQLIREDESLPVGKGIVHINVNFDTCEIFYTYLDYDDETATGKLYFDKVEVI